MRSGATMGLFEALNTIGATLATIMKPLLAKFQLMDKVITYVKDESSNLNTLVVTLFSIVTYAPLQLEDPLASFCYGHVMSKACQYATIDTKLCVGMKEVLLKDVHSTLQRTMLSIKKSSKGKQKWDKICIEAKQKS
jgi:hypothetical protein